MDEDISLWWDNLDDKAQAEIKKAYDLVLSLPPSLRMYYNIKGGYFMRRKLISVLISLAVILVGVGAYFLQQNPLLAIGLVVLGIGLGVLFVWEVESK